MINVNKLLMGVIVATTVVVKAEETAKSEVVTQQIYTTFKKLYENVTSQENVDKAKDYINKGLEQTEKVFIQYPMYAPAGFLLVKALQDVGKVIKDAKKTTKNIKKTAHTLMDAKDTENLLKESSKTLRRARGCMGVGLVFLAGHFYYNHNEKPVTVNLVEKKQTTLPTEKDESVA